MNWQRNRRPPPVTTEGDLSRSCVSAAGRRHTLWTSEDEAFSIVQNRGFAGDSYLRGSRLGCGGWGVVYKVLRIEDGGVFAGKSSAGIRELKREASILRSLVHQHILGYVDWHEEEGNPEATLLITELCIAGNLQTRIDNATHGMERTHVLMVIVQIADALEYLHRRNMFHTDLKPRNILIRRLSPIDVVLADCADAKPTGHGIKGPARGTPTYWSPEVLRHNRHCGKPDDIWALGVTVLGMVAQWPRLVYTKEEIRKYPKTCFDHVQTLVELNPGHGIVGLLGRMMAWDAGDRTEASACKEVAERLLEEAECEDVRVREDLGINMPGNFQPISFW